MDVEIMSDTEEKMVIKDHEGKVHECEKLFTFDSDETKLSYICKVCKLKVKSLV